MLLSTNLPDSDLFVATKGYPSLNMQALSGSATLAPTFEEPVIKSLLSFDRKPVSGSVILDCPGFSPVAVPMIPVASAAYPGSPALVIPAQQQLKDYYSIVCEGNFTFVDALQQQFSVLQNITFLKMNNLGTFKI